MAGGPLTVEEREIVRLVRPAYAGTAVRATGRPDGDGFALSAGAVDGPASVTGTVSLGPGASA